MILVDTSAWVEFTRATGSTVNVRVRHLLADDAELATSEPVVMELLAGAPSDRHLADLRRLLAGRTFLFVDGLADYEAAALLFRRCRVGGETIRSMLDCLLAAVALRADVPVLHADRDFDAIARHTALRLDG